MTASELESAITNKTTCVMINSPCNPTGAVYSLEELTELAKVVEKHNLVVISDEIYEKLIYDGNKHYSIASVSNYMKENTIVINGVSKTYSMTGWRIGYLAAPKAIASVISRVQGHTASNATSFAQYATITALSGGEDIVNNMKNEFDNRRKYMMQRFDNIGINYIKPEGAFYLFVDISKFIGKEYNGKKITGSMSFADAVIDGGIALIPGLPFYQDNYVRLSYAVSMSDIEEGLNRFENIISNIK